MRLIFLNSAHIFREEGRIIRKERNEYGLRKKMLESTVLSRGAEQKNRRG